MDYESSSDVPQLSQHLRTPLCDLFNIRHPICAAGMNVCGPELCAAVINAGGLGVIGGVGYTPNMLRTEIAELKSLLKDKNAPFGVDLLIPQVGGSARATNSDYTKGHLPELIDIICESGAKLFVCAVGVPPKWAVDKLHAKGILVQNMCGAPKHALKAVEAGCDLLAVQGSEGGGHTGEIATMVLIPQVVDAVRGKMSPLTGKQIMVMGAGGIFDGRGLAAALALGAQGVWVGTRFVASFESKAGPRHLKALLEADSDQTVRTTIFTGRPMRVRRTAYITEWEEKRRLEMAELQGKGIVPVQADFSDGSTLDAINAFPFLMGQAAGPIHKSLPAALIVNDMVVDASRILSQNAAYVCGGKAKL